MKTYKSIFASVAITFATASTVAADNFSTIEGIPATAMTGSEMEKVEGKMVFFPTVPSPAALFRQWSAPTLADRLRRIQLTPGQLRTIGRAYPRSSACFFSVSVCRKQLLTNTAPVGASRFPVFQDLDRKYGNLFRLGEFLMGR